jgi:hypothetical protein
MVLQTAFTQKQKVPPGTKQIKSDIAEVKRFIDLEEVSFFEWAVVYMYAKQTYGEEQATGLMFDSNAVIKVYGNDFWQELKRNKMQSNYPVVGLGLEQIKRYCEVRSTMVKMVTGVIYTYELPHTSDYKQFKPKPSKYNQSTPAHSNKAAKTQGVRGLFDNIGELLMGDEGPHKMLPSGTSEAVSPDDIYLQTFRCVATLDN